MKQITLDYETYQKELEEKFAAGRLQEISRARIYIEGETWMVDDSIYWKWFIEALNTHYTKKVDHPQS